MTDPKPTNWSTADVEVCSNLANLEDSLYDPHVRRAVEEIAALSEEVGELSPSEWAAFLAQFETEYLAAYIGEQVLVTGMVTEYGGESIGGYVQKVIPGVSESVWCADRQMKFNGCMVEQRDGKAKIVLSGIDQVADEHGNIQAMTYGIPLDALLVFPEIYSSERNHAALHTLMPNLMSELDELLIGQEHAEASSVLTALKELPLDDLARFNDAFDLEQAVNHLNSYLGEMIKFDQHMAYEVEFEGSCCINNQWYEATLPGVLMAGKTIAMVAQSAPDNPGQIYLRLVVGGVMLDAHYQDQTFMLLPINGIQRFESLRAKILRAQPDEN